MWRHRTQVARLSAQDRTTGDDAINRPTRAQLVEVETQEKDNNETVHEGSQTTETISSCMDAAVSPNSRRTLLLLFATDVMIPASI
jgi:hypothetical protein